VSHPKGIAVYIASIEPSKISENLGQKLTKAEGLKKGKV
jgi:hypothetical protein